MKSSWPQSFPFPGSRGSSKCCCWTLEDCPLICRVAVAPGWNCQLESSSSKKSHKIFATFPWADKFSCRYGDAHYRTLDAADLRHLIFSSASQFMSTLFSPDESNSCTDVDKGRGRERTPCSPMSHRLRRKLAKCKVGTRQLRLTATSTLCL